METWDLDIDDVSRIRKLLQHDLLLWGADAGGDIAIAFKGSEGSLRAWPLSKSHDDGNDLLASVARIEALLHGDAASGRSLSELANDIEHLVQRATEAQDRVVESERKAGQG